MPSPPRISVIVPAYNAAATLPACLTALTTQINVPTPYEIIIIDDGSTDNTAEIARQAGVHLYQQPRHGPAAARNAGLHIAQGDIACFTDADCVPQPDWLAVITAPLLADPTLAGCKGAYLTQQRQIVARFVQLEYEDKYDRLRQYARITFMDFYSAAYRRSILIDNGGFDERFIANSEDRELSYRLAARGYPMVFVPQALVSHWHAHTGKGYVRKKILNGYWTAQAVRQFPERTVEDTYTPQVQKVQIGLMGLLLGTAVSSLLFPPLLLITTLLGAIFLASTLPFSRKAWAKDKTIALCSPALLAVRALALGLGYAWGLLRPIHRAN